MWPNEENSSFVRRKSKLSLNILKKSGSSNDNSTIRIQSNQALHLNPVTNSTIDVEPEDNLDDFKSPIKLDTRPKKAKRKDVRPYRRPGDTTCTQDILIDAYKKAKENDIEYRSEDEFVIFHKPRQSKEERQILDESGSCIDNEKENNNSESKHSAEDEFVIFHKPRQSKEERQILDEGGSCIDKEKENNNSESKHSAEDKFAKPVLPLITIEQTSKVNNKCNSNKSLRKEYKNFKLNDVIIEDSEDEVIPCSQIVVRGNSLKTVNDRKVKTETLTRMKNENADLKSSMQTGTFSSGNCSIRLLYLEQQTDKGTVYFIPKQNCLPIPVLVSDQDSTNILNIDTCKVPKIEVLNNDNISIHSKSNNVIQQEKDPFSNLESSISLHNVPESNLKYNVDSSLEQSTAQTSESTKLQIVGKNSQLGRDEIQMTEETLDLQPSQSNVSEFAKISKGLRKPKVRKNVETKSLKFSSRVLIPRKCRSKKLQFTCFRKLWWRSKYLKRKYRHCKAGMTRSGVRFRS